MPLLTITNMINRRVLPTAFGESLSYYEEIIALVDKINEVVEFVNGITDASKTYTDQQITTLSASLASQITAMYNYANTINVNLTSLIGSTRAELITLYTSLINSKTSELNSRITSEVNTLNGRITYEMQVLKDYIDNQAIDIKVLSAITGQMMSVQQAFNELADLQKIYAFTASDYDYLEILASAYDAKELTALDFDFNGTQLLP